MVTNFMIKPDYLSKYKFDWEMLDVVVGGKSALDAEHFFGEHIDRDRIDFFLKGYGVNSKDPISKAELFGNFQESIQFIKRYFLKEGNKDDGIDLKIPNSILMVTDVGELFDKISNDPGDIESSWAEIVLKVMHTILHIDKDLRTKYFSTIQTQILDRFYRYIQRRDEQLYLGDGLNSIPLIEFDTKTKKTRDSVILKLLHKAEHVAEELFDRVGIRFVTRSKLDCIRVVEFLLEQGVVIPHNIKPSRSINNLINFESLKKNYFSLIKVAIKNEISEGRFVQALERDLSESPILNSITKNDHSFDSYKSIQITARQLIKYDDPFLSEFFKVKRFINESSDVNSEVKKKINGLDLSSLTRDVEFFYPFEIQIVDVGTNENNKIGDASHVEYKRIQLISARDRLFKKLI